MKFWKELMFLVIVCFTIVTSHKGSVSRKRYNDKITLQSLFQAMGSCKGQFVCDIYGGFHCIPTWKVCNGFNDCGNNADEALCDLKRPNCPFPSMTCSDKKSCGIVCNNKIECPYSEDEKHCLPKCKAGEIACPEGGRCAKICDGYKECKESEDEQNCPFCCPDGKVKCSLKRTKQIGCATPCDTIEECDEGNDEMPVNKACVFQGCPNGQLKCILAAGEEGCATPCDKNTECRDGSNELPDNEQCDCERGFVKCILNNGQIGCASICDGGQECRDVNEIGGSEPHCDILKGFCGDQQDKFVVQTIGNVIFTCCFFEDGSNICSNGSTCASIPPLY